MPFSLQQEVPLTSTIKEKYSAQAFSCNVVMFRNLTRGTGERAAHYSYGGHDQAARASRPPTEQSCKVIRKSFFREQEQQRVINNIISLNTVTKKTYKVILFCFLFSIYHIAFFCLLCIYSLTLQNI